MSLIISSPSSGRVDGGRWPEDYDNCPVCHELSVYIPTGRCRNGCDLGAGLDMSALAHVLANMSGIPDVWEPARPGEPWADVIAREDAARDMVVEFLAEVAGEVAA